MDDIVTRLLNIASLKGDIGGTVIPVACNDAADEIERLRAEVDRWKNLCERGMSYKVGSDWQDIRILYEMALKDYHAQRSS